jgi:cyanophycin synthetase
MKLKDQGLNTKSVLEKNQSVIVKSSVNQNNFRDNHRHLTDVHISYQEIGRRVQEVLNINLLGIDVITSDVNIALEDSGGGINEINTTPALHHHDLISNSEHAYPVGLLALEYIFSSNKANTPNQVSTAHD